MSCRQSLGISFPTGFTHSHYVKRQLFLNLDDLPRTLRGHAYLGAAGAHSPNIFDAIASTCCGVILAKTPPHADEVVS
jgi:hypothetical protein